MTNTYRTGVPSWADLATSDMAGAQKFYGELLGWTFGETREDLGGYTQAFVDGKPAVGFYHLQEGMTTSVWSVYFATDDIAKTAELIEQNGGTIIAPPMEVQELGHMLVAADSTGAVFGAWQEGTFAGSPLGMETGAHTWRDLRSKNPAAAREFYTAVFGYRHDEVGSPIDYQTFNLDGIEMPLGGIGEMMGAPAEVPSHWAVYLRVADTEKALAFVTSAGGSVIAPMFDTPFGRQATVVDPWGGAFNVIDWTGVQ